MSTLLRLMGRHDLSLVAGLAVASFCIFSDSVATTLTAVRRIEAAYGLELVPGLVVLATAFCIRQAEKYRLSRAESRQHARLAAGAEARASRTEWLVSFGHALGAAFGSLSQDSVHDVIAREIPKLFPGRDVWVLTRARDRTWTSVVAGDSSPAEREGAARFALGDVDPSSKPESRHVCFPLVVGETAVGVLGVKGAPPLTDDERRVLEATAALIAVAIRNADLVEQTRASGVRDRLTGFFNRAHTLETLDSEMRRARRSKHPLSIIMLDLDGLKTANDVRGHLCGDALITATSAAVRKALRGSDVKCRYGGDEFVVILPETPIEGAERVAEGLRQDVQAAQVWWNGDRIGVTASLGVTALTDEDQAPEALIARADAALLRAKALGRNVVSSSREGNLAAPPPQEV